jgi:thioredoxin reductase
VSTNVADVTCEMTDSAAGRRTMFSVTLGDGSTHSCRKLLLATGVIDVLPDVAGVEEFYGRSVHHCPYCDGYEHRDESIAAYGQGASAAGLALNLLTWSSRITACTDGTALSTSQRRRLRRNGIGLREERIVQLEGANGKLERLVFVNGPALDCTAMFFNTEHLQRSPLAEQLGCDQDRAGHIITSRKQRTRRPGLFLAGDADGDVQFVIVAAAEGATAAVAINKELQAEDRGEKRAEPIVGSVARGRRRRTKPPVEGPGVREPSRA